MSERETMRRCSHVFDELYPECKKCGFDALKDQDVYTKEDNKERSKCNHEWRRFYWESGSYYASVGHECTICAKCYKIKQFCDGMITYTIIMIMLGIFTLLFLLSLVLNYI